MIKKKISTNFPRILYVSFCLLGIYHVIVNQYDEAAMNFGIALAFDPFDTSVSWKRRPSWQKVWLLTHLGICMAVFGLHVGLNQR